MTQAKKTQAKKTLKERFLHAFLFEIIAIGLCAPVAAWAMGKSLFEMGVLTAVIAWENSSSTSWCRTSPVTTRSTRS